MKISKLAVFAAALVMACGTFAVAQDAAPAQLPVEAATVAPMESGVPMQGAPVEGVPMDAAPVYSDMSAQPYYSQPMATSGCGCGTAMPMSTPVYSQAPMMSSAPMTTTSAPMMDAQPMVSSAPMQYAAPAPMAPMASSGCGCGTAAPAPVASSCGCNAAPAPAAPACGCNAAPAPVYTASACNTCSQAPRQTRRRLFNRRGNCCN